MKNSKSLRDDWIIPVLRELVKEDQLEHFLKNTSGDFWNSAVKAGLVTDGEILESLSRKTRIHVARHPLVSDADASAVIPAKVARQYGVVPLQVSKSTLRVATGNPYDLHCEQALSFLSGRNVNFELASPAIIAERIREVYTDNESPNYSPYATYNKASAIDAPLTIDDLVKQIHTAFTDSGITSRDGPVSSRDKEKDIEGPIISLVDHIVADGINRGASDIHCESEEDGIAVRYRIDGVLQHALTLPKSVGLPLVSRIKIMAQLDISDRLRPQGGRIRVSADRRNVDLRVSTLPAADGEKVVIRILNDQSSLHSLDRLGLPNHLMVRLQSLLETREGLILITGPTGSGKTTTLYAALQQLLQKGLNIITVEDPVEYRVPGIVQVQVNEKAGLTFASALRSILRQDPDVVLIGEVRDRETAAIAIQAALTGHLVFATLHTIDACSSITRLHDLGIEPAKVASALKGVIAQRLVRRLCRECTHPSQEPVPLLLWDSIPSGASLTTSKGCNQCGHTGYKGRIAVPEIVPVNAPLARLISQAASTQQLIDAVRKSGVDSLWGAGVAYLLNGITSAEELMRVLDPDDRIREYDTTAGTSSRTMTVKIDTGVVDIYLVDRSTTPWQVLTLQRAADTQRPQSWETVHGKMKDDELPEQAALREVNEETGLSVNSMYSVTAHCFYLPTKGAIQIATVFCAFVDSSQPVTLSVEHQRYQWLPIDEAEKKLTWPRAGKALREIKKLLGDDSIRTVEDVLKVK